MSRARGSSTKPMSFAARGGLICESEDESEGDGR
jgi:hypothetical protein